MQSQRRGGIDCLPSAAQQLLQRACARHGFQTGHESIVFDCGSHAMFILPLSLLFSASALLHCLTASPLPFPLDSFRIRAPPSHILTDVDTPALVLQDAWMSTDTGMFSPLPGLLPHAPVLLQFIYSRAEEVSRFAQTQVHDSEIDLALSIQTCVRLLEDTPVLPVALTAIGARPVSFFPPSLRPDNTDADGSICFSSADLPLHAAMASIATMRCSSFDALGPCEVSSPQLEELHLTATADSDNGAPALLLHRIYSSRSTLYLRSSVETIEGSRVAQSVFFIAPLQLI
jgi:hypothetical protein